MDDMSALKTEISNLFRDKLHVEVPTFETDLVEKGVLDSLTFVDLLLQLEQIYGVKIFLDQLEMDHFRSIATIASFVLQQKNNGAASSAHTAQEHS